jgi:DNA-binding transcriptional LysR family regulator
MDLDHLKTFMAIYRHGTLTDAATALHISQPAVSQQLKALEAEIGRPLFIRGARGVTPTPIAHALANEVAEHVDALASAASTFRSGAAPLEATVVIGGPADCLSTLVLPALAALVNKGLRVVARTGLTKDLVSRLSDGELDLVIATTPGRQAGVTLIPLFEETLVLVAHPTTARRVDRKQIATGNALSLRHVPIVAFAENLPLLRRYWREVFSGQPPAAAVVVDDLRGVIAIVAAGGGVTAAPSYLVASHLIAGTLVSLAPPTNAPTNTLYLAQRTGRATPAINTVAQHLHDQAWSWG